jgi:hypothetical protein
VVHVVKVLADLGLRRLALDVGREQAASGVHFMNCSRPQFTAKSCKWSTVKL